MKYVIWGKMKNKDKMMFGMKLGVKWFDSKVKCRKFINDLLKGRDGIIEDYWTRDILWDLLQFHPSLDLKTGVGLNYFYFDENGILSIMRVDGSSVDFGVTACLDGIYETNLNFFRSLVRVQVEAYKRSFVGNASYFDSEYSGTKFHVSQINCDHLIPFRYILDKFCSLSKVNLYSQKFFENPSENQILLDKWFKFHKMFPLRVVSAQENASDIRKDDNERGEEYFQQRIDEILLRNDWIRDNPV
jgi:hypothetical protein